MHNMYDFSVLRLVPDTVRGEVINIGIVVFKGDGLDVRLRPTMTRARSIYPEFNDELLNEAVKNLQRLGSVDLSPIELHRGLSHIGPLALGDLGYFTAKDDSLESYEANIVRLLNIFVAAPKTSTVSEHRPSSRLAAGVRGIFRREKVLAKSGDVGALQEHKIVPAWPLPNGSDLKADLALKNGIMRVCEIVDLSVGSDDRLPLGLYEGVVTLDASQSLANAEERVFAYRGGVHSSKVDAALKLAQMHANRFVDWDNVSDRETFVHDWINAAARTDPKTKARSEPTLVM